MGIPLLKDGNTIIIGWEYHNYTIGYHNYWMGIPLLKDRNTITIGWEYHNYRIRIP